MTPLKVRLCKICQEVKPANNDHFYKHGSCRDGLSIYCKSCAKEKRRTWARENTTFKARRRAEYAAGGKARQRELSENRARNNPFLHTAESMTSNIVQRARKKGLSLSPDVRNKRFIAAWLERQPNCECCGAEFLLGPKGVVNDSSPSIDRMDPRLGYELENVSLICWRCNNIKRNFSSYEIRRVADWIDRRSDAGETEDRASLFASCRTQAGEWVDRTQIDRSVERADLVELEASA
jgi:hypothetical protein